MIISNEPLVPNETVKFTVKGFPDEDAVKNSIERFYAKALHADRIFEIQNVFQEPVMSGKADEAGKIIEFNHLPRPKKG